MPTVPSLAGNAQPRPEFAPRPVVSWRRDLAQALRSLTELLEYLQLSPGDFPPGSLLSGTLPAGSANSPVPTDRFPVLVPRSFADRMTRKDPTDPLLRQVLPFSEEAATVPGFSADAVGDQFARTAPGLLQKYDGRVLLISTGTCAVHCRYCFRREYPYDTEPRRLDDWTPALDVIRSDDSIHEIILSGGDPLMLPDERLAALCLQIDAIPHVERLRIHTRLPVVLPSRVTSDLLTLLRTVRTQPIVVIHANHAHELQSDCADAVRRLVRAGVPVLNQSVLLRGVNDSVDALADLSRCLVGLGVMPYYLHQLDRVTGTSHFEVSREHGLRLIAGLEQRLPGYAVPRYVEELPGAPGKTPIRPA